MPEPIADELLSTKSPMLSLDEACQRAAACARPIEARETIALGDALRRVLATEIRANLALPRFDQSAMDGYAFAASSLKGIETELLVTSRVAAGGSSSALQPGAATRIFTGAVIPPGADTVIMQEHVRREGPRIVIDGPIRKGSNIRRRGEDVAEGDVLFERGQRLAVHHLALLAAQGFAHADVLRRVRVAFVSTGDEIKRVGELLGPTSIYDSNATMLIAAAREAGLDAHDGGRLRDDPVSIAAHLSHLSNSFDLVVTTGGASVGEEDHAFAAIAATGADVASLKLAVKPGKPALVGRIGAAVYLGLPGNPVSCLLSWLFLGNAIVAALNGATPKRPAGYPIAILSEFSHKPGRTEFAPARLVATEAGLQAEILGRGGSVRLKPLIHADGLAEISSGSGDLERGDHVLFHPFRDGFTVG
jgi:molybdopterin molybdotransferase